MEVVERLVAARADVEAKIAVRGDGGRGWVGAGEISMAFILFFLALCNVAGRWGPVGIGIGIG